MVHSEFSFLFFSFLFKKIIFQSFPADFTPQWSTVRVLQAVWSAGYLHIP